MILIGLTGSIGHGKTTFAHALTKLVPKAEVVETYELVAEVIDALQAQTKQIPTKEVDSINQWIEVLPSILAKTVHFDCTFEQIQLTSKDIRSNPNEYQKLFDYLDEVNDNSKLINQEINEANKSDYRSILQWIGGYMVYKLDHGIWFNELIRRSKLPEHADKRLFIIGGVRFISDAETVRQSGGKVIAIARPGFITQDLQVPMEQESQMINADCTVINNGTVDELSAFAGNFWADLSSGKLKPEYTTT